MLSGITRKRVARHRCVAPAESKPYCSSRVGENCVEVEKWADTLVAPTEDKQYGRFSGESQFYDRQTLRGSGEIHKRGGNLGVHPCAHRRGYGIVPVAGAALSRAPQSAIPC